MEPVVGRDDADADIVDAGRSRETPIERSGITREITRDAVPGATTVVAGLDAERPETLVVGGIPANGDRGSAGVRAARGWGSE